MAGLVFLEETKLKRVMSPIMDKTGLFRDILKDVQNRGDFDKPGPDKNRILKSSQRPQKDPLEIKAHAILEHTSELNSFLSQNRDSYVDVLNREYSSNAMTDLDRDKIDAGANALIRTINGLVGEFKKNLKSRMTKLSVQHTSHLEAVGDILDGNLKSACHKYSEQKAIRVQKELEIQKLSRLEIKARKASASRELVNNNGDIPEEVMEVEEERPKAATKYNWALDDDDQDDQDMTLEEMQLFERENEKMYDNLMSLKDDVQKIESKVIKIAELQEIFTEKVLQQKDDIDLISANAVASTENVKDGNEEIRKAIQSNASMRVYILFFLLVMSFTLLFLDWYNE